MNDASVLSQRAFWRHESYRYFARNYLERNLRALRPNVHLERLLEAHPLPARGGAVLELGCGPANNLHFLVRHVAGSRGVGLEPSRRTVSALAARFPEYEFVAADAAALPFATGEFDVVLLRSFLHWVDRQHVLQTLGEALRVCSGFMIVSDFAPAVSYSTVYHHEPNYRTYKMRYAPLLEASGQLRPLASLTSNEADPWLACETVLYRKLPLDEAFPLRSEPEVRQSMADRLPPPVGSAARRGHA